jgi:hypothetical protein
MEHGPRIPSAVRYERPRAITSRPQTDPRKAGTTVRWRQRLHEGGEPRLRLDLPGRLRGVGRAQAVDAGEQMHLQFVHQIAVRCLRIHSQHHLRR